MRYALLAVTALWPVAAFGQASSNNFSPLPSGVSMSTLQSALQTNAVASNEYGGNPITLQAGDITPGSGGSVTDAQGNVYTLPMSPNGLPMGIIYENGSPADGGTLQYSAAIRVVNGVLYNEDGKGHGWFTWSNGVYALAGDPGQGTPAMQSSVTGSAADTAAPSNTPSPSSGQSCPGMTLPGAATPNGGTFTANGSTYSVDATNGDVASINGAPINQGAYETSQLVQGSDGAIYGQSNAAANNGQWFTLQGSGGDTWWQASSAPPTAVSGGSATTASTSTDTTAQDRVASVVCPQIASIQAQISAANQQMQQLMAQQAQLIAQQQMTAAPTAPIATAIVPAPADSTSSGGGGESDGGGGEAQ